MDQGETPEGEDCCTPSFWGWSPRPLPAETTLQRLVDRFLPRTGLPLLAYLGVVVGLLLLAPAFPRRAELTTDGVAALVGGSWCGLNFWRCRHAHCAVTGAGWLALSAFCFFEAGLGRSLIAGDEQLVFVGVLAVALAFEWTWYRRHGSNALRRHVPARVSPDRT